MFPPQTCTLYWATLHPTKLCCIQLSYTSPSELSCTILSYAASFWATLYTTELRLTPSELRSTLKNIMYPARRSFADLYSDINDVLRKPREMSQFG